MNIDFNQLYLTTEGRIGRQSFWIGIIGFIVVSIVINVIAVVLFGHLSFATRLIQFILQLALAYPGYALMTKRFQDRDRPGTTYAAVVVAINILYALLALFGLVLGGVLGGLFGLIMLAIGIWILIDLGILRGTVGDNVYGPDPLKA